MDTSSLVPAALQFVREVDAAYPNRNRTSDGSVASAEHTAGNPTSDHEHGTPQPGDRDIDAVDIDRDLVPGDLAASDDAMHGDVLFHFQTRHRAQYWIFKDMISFADEGWVPRSYAYAGPNRSRHMEHAHCNWREDSASHNDTTPYGIEGDTMDQPTFNTLMDSWWTSRLDPKVKDNPQRTALRRAPWAQLVTAGGLSVFSVLFGEMRKSIEDIAAHVASPPAVTLSEADRSAIVAGLGPMVQTEVTAALEGIELAPRKNTP